ncbi:Leucine-rich receptor-like protein kinase family protein [Rhynchospora pubera]|uniref:non-specific serine/threonine protein kinase n=1 Tax=Rhynchospora pubera TaxID=906938 RepID=A0AAV8FBY2_9POAL|nr:Leucine-rich receptor-like protein kinase family protein [Rhynchospora pubera]
MHTSKITTSKFLFIFLTILQFFTYSINGAGSDDMSALLSLKSGLVDPLGLLNGWKDPPYCKWTGVACDSLNRVTSLDLSNMNISGQISNDITLLTGLTYLNLSLNSFSNSLPKSLSTLINLKSFDVSANSFVGNFPSGLSLCTGLTVLNASGNNFEGPLPDEFSKATSLEILDLRGSFFEGEIPASYRSLKRLKFLGLSGNNLTGQIPPELGDLISLENLIIGYNELEGSIPAELGNLANLQCLDLAVGNLGGDIPPELGKLQQLTTLYLYRNSIGGHIPREIGNMSSLVFLDISNNLISGNIPSEISQLKNLQLINLMCNQLTGLVPNGIADLSKLEILELWNNSLTGSLPNALGLTSPLQWLDVSSNALSGMIPPGLCAGGSLTKLILFGNSFSGPIPANLSACATLVRVRMQNNRLNGTIPVGLGKLPRLQRLELASNELQGDIPSDLTSSTSLSFIDFSHNNIQFFLPSNIFSIPTLQTFLASDNQLTGNLPDQFQECPSLAALDLSNNRLTGSIPSSLSSCQRLVNLNLQHNRFTGPIPSSIAMMPTLAILDLSSNFLTGSIPENFGSSPALETLNLSYNNLTGPVPSNGILRSINPDDLAGNKGLCGGVLPPCTGIYATESSKSLKSIRLKRIVMAWVIGIAVMVGMGLILFGGHYLYRKWYLDGGCCLEENNTNEPWLWRLTAFQKLNFTSAEIVACVKESNVIGMGATGIVYKAELTQPHSVIAVKKLWRPGPTHDEDRAELSAEVAKEVALLGRLRHRNIVRLLGYVHNNSDCMMLYEYMPNGSLWEALHGGSAETGQVLLSDWNLRYNVATGVAQGLAYMHHDCHPPVIHRDVKSSNILLDANLEARIADFGLARIMTRKNESVSVVAGSHGYIAPEYGYTLKVDQKSDIYSFGVVLMELLTGKRPIEPEFGEGQDIVGWIREKIRSNQGVEQVLDPNAGGRCKHVQEEMLLVLRIAVLCTTKLPRDRPSMRDVLTMLGEAKPRRKSGSSGSTTGHVVDKDKPVFSPAPDSNYH